MHISCAMYVLSLTALEPKCPCLNHLFVYCVSLTGFFTIFFSAVKHSIVLMRNCSVFLQVCPPYGICTHIMSGHPRPHMFPGLQQSSGRLLPFCMNGRCYFQSLTMIDAALDRPPSVVAHLINVEASYTASVMNSKALSFYSNLFIVGA